MAREEEVFVTRKPEDPAARELIAHYYFHRSFSQDFFRQFVFYPNYRHALTVYSGSEVRASASESNVIPAVPGKRSEILYTINMDRALRVRLSGKIDKIGIVFEPFGMNRLVDQPLSESLPERIGVPFNLLGPEFDCCLEDVFSTTDPDVRVRLLDRFFASRQRFFDDHIVLKAIGEICASNGAIRVEELAEKVHCSTKTLLRLFRKHLLCSVSEYKQLVRFRTTLDEAMQISPELQLKLTDLALKYQYYDQADFIRYFRKISGQSPKKLFARIDSWGQHGIYWKKLDE